jgi:hypothetical protein
VLTASINFGGHRLSISFDRRRRGLRLEDKDIELPPDANVVLVDEVERKTGVTVTKTIVLDQAGESADPRRGRLGQLLERSREVASFLRCDAGMLTTGR